MTSVQREGLLRDATENNFEFSMLNFQFSGLGIWSKFKIENSRSKSCTAGLLPYESRRANFGGGSLE
jgi:hypothetical protein